MRAVVTRRSAVVCRFAQLSRRCLGYQRPVFQLSRRCLKVAASASNPTPMTTFSNITDRVTQQLVAEGAQSNAIPIYTAAASNASLEGIPVGLAAAWAKVNSFKAKAGEVLSVPNESGSLSCAVLGLGEGKGADLLWAYAALPGKLPAGTYKLAAGVSDPDQALLGWVLGECLQTFGLLADSLSARTARCQPWHAELVHGRVSVMVCRALEQADVWLHVIGEGISRTCATQW